MNKQTEEGVQESAGLTEGEREKFRKTLEVRRTADREYHERQYAKYGKHYDALLTGGRNKRSEPPNKNLRPDWQTNVRRHKAKKSEQKEVG